MSEVNVASEEPEERGGGSGTRDPWGSSAARAQSRSNASEIAGVEKHFEDIEASDADQDAERLHKKTSVEGEDDAEERYQRFLEDCEKQRQENPVAYYIAWPALKFKEFAHWAGSWLYWGFIIVLCVAYLAFLIAALVLNFDKSWGLLLLTAIVVLLILWELFVAPNWDTIMGWFQWFFDFFDAWYTWIKWGFILVCAALLLAFVIIEAVDDAVKMVPVGGFIVFVYLSVLFSLYPHRLVWRPVLWGFGVSFVFGLIVMRTTWGFDALQWVSDYVAEFLAFADIGSEFVFGPSYGDFWAFFVLPVILYVGGVVAVLYYWGAMQYIVRKIAWLMQKSLKTSGAESTVGAANIFIGQTESPLLVGPYLPIISNSELVSVMTTGFASIAGSVLGAFIAMGIPSVDLLTACVTSAPAALATAKLTHPEVDENSDSNEQIKAGFKSKAGNFVEAFAMGVSEAIPLVLNIGAMLIGFLAIIAFLDAVTMWLGHMVNVQDLTLTEILGYIFWPFVFLCGIEEQDCSLAGQFAAIRVVGNEFLAFIDLQEAMQKRLWCCDKRDSDGDVQWLSPRSESICVYILCGFANFGSTGMVIGALSALCPPRAKDIARLVIPALWAANMACFVRGCISGLLYQPRDDGWDPTCPEGPDWRCYGSTSTEEPPEVPGVFGVSVPAFMAAQ